MSIMSSNYMSYKDREETAWIDLLEAVNVGDLDRVTKLVFYLKKLKKLQSVLPTIDA